MADDVGRIKAEELFHTSSITESTHVAEATVVFERPQSEVRKVLVHHSDTFNWRDTTIVQVKEVRGVEVILNDVRVVDVVVEDGFDWLGLHVSLALGGEEGRVGGEEFSLPYPHHPLVLDDSVATLAIRHALPNLGVSLWVLVGHGPLSRDVGALALLPERPTMVEALELSVLYCPHGKGSRAVRADIGHTDRGAGSITIDHHGLVPELESKRFEDAVLIIFEGKLFAVVSVSKPCSLDGRVVAAYLPGVSYCVPGVVEGRVVDYVFVEVLGRGVGHYEVLLLERESEIAAGSFGVAWARGRKVYSSPPPRSVLDQIGVELLEEGVGL
mmetsp:Transcript_10820/g.22217  ORF Transcript_10820/g.22217 Transcript_10820/m.22217 type:complete len:328 (-) Transcript_10820:1106-2089(-)